MKLGSNDISAVKIGSTDVSKVYIGSTEVWSSFTGLLDTYTGAAAAYSLRQLKSGVTNAIEVRRASDNTTQDIGFVDGELDTTSLASFCSGTDGFVTTWYDQSGNGNDATQTTAASQPQIVSSGSVITENGKPAVQFDGSDDYMTLSSISLTDRFSEYIVNTHTSVTSGNQSIGITRWVSTTNNRQFTLRIQSDTEYDFFISDDGSNSYSISNYSSATVNTQYLHASELNLSESQEFEHYRNNVLISSTFSSGYSNLFNSTVNMELCSFNGGGSPFQGYLQEVVFYASDQSSNRTGIETNINDFYSIYYVPSDSDAQAFVSRVETAGGSLSYTESQAVDTLVSDLKDAGIWTKMKAIYPMVGASAAACAQNLKSSSFTGTFNGGVTFSSNGVQFNGTSGYLDTQFVPSVEFGAGNGSISVYSRTSGSRSADFGRYTGSQNAIVAYVSLNGRVYSYFGDTGYTFQADTNNGLGLFNYQRTSNSNKNVFVNSTKVLNANTTFTGWPNLFMPIGAYFLNATFQETSGREFAFAHLGDALTDTEASDFYTAVQAFQTTLSRNV